jgi:hypothetical protein
MKKELSSSCQVDANPLGFSGVVSLVAASNVIVVIALSPRFNGAEAEVAAATGEFIFIFFMANLRSALR